MPVFRDKILDIHYFHFESFEAFFSKKGGGGEVKKEK